MAKRICSIIMALACCLSFAFPSAFAEETTQCEHERGQVTVVDAPYCGHDGKVKYTCVKCGETVEEVEPMQAAEHNYVVDKEASTPLDCETTDGITVEVCKNCGDKKTTTVEHSGSHITEFKNQKDATCTDEGYTGDEVCTVCGKIVKSGEKIDALGHDTETQNEKDATCTEKGYTGDKVCKVCGKVVKKGEEIPAIGHLTETQNEKDATCTEKGYTGDKVCTVCGKVVEKGEETPTIAHSTETQNAKDPTCTDKGYTGDEVCKVCGTVVEKGEEIDINPDAHKWDDGVVTVDSTCTKEGVKTFTCQYCGKTRTESIALIAHTYVKVADAVKPTCEEKGKTEAFECSVCGHKMGGEEIAALGHDTEIQNAKVATCTEKGYTGDKVCKVCGKVVEKGEEIPLAEHTIVIKDAIPETCKVDGYTGDKVCKVCGEILEKGKIIPAAHDWDYAHQQVNDATCTADGSVVTVCERCHETMTSIIKAKGHNKDVVVAATDSTCTTRGNREYYRCSYCNLAYSYNHKDWMSNIDEYLKQPLGHDYQKTDAVEATCTENGNKEYYTCAREGCGKFFMDQDGKKVECEKDAWVVKALGHKETVVGNVEATCTTDGKTGDTVCATCGEILKASEDIPAFGHNWVEGKKIDPTCTEVGYQYYTCSNSNCQAEKAEEIPALGHDYKFTSTTATCTENGISTYTCAVCGDIQTWETPALGHTPEVKDAKDATCTEKGYTGDKVCSVCGEVLEKGEEIDALGHKTEIQDKKDADCGNDGYTGDEVCTVCGEVIQKGEVISATGEHSYDDGELTTPASCTEKGVITYTCEVCGDTKTEEIPAFGHTWTLDPTKSYEPTTEKDGLEVYYCPVCGETYEKILPKKDATHIHSYILTDKKTATCTEDGFETFKCLGCGDTYTTTYHKLGHKAATSWTVVKDATCTKEGSKVRYCTVCGDIVETATIDALGHKAVVDAAKSATCTETGLTEGKHCSVCGEVLVAQEVVPALGHKEVVDAAKSATCTETGLTEGKHCSVCGEVLVAQEVVPALGHKTEVKNAKEETCGVDGYTGDEICSVCGEVIAKGKVIPATGKHTFDNGVVTTAPTCTADGVKTYTCKDCGVTKTEKVPALGHKVVVKNNKVATYFEDGYTGDTVCATCGKTIATGSKIAKFVLNKPVIKVVKGKKKLTVKIAKVSGATKYQISVKIKGKWKVFTTAKTSYTVKKLVSGKKYKVKVRAIVTSGSKTAYSAWSAIKTVKVK